jgi:hypothetical protein
VNNKTRLSGIELDVVVGTPICRRSAFVFDRFLHNQQEIQEVYPGCKLILATDEVDYVAELKQEIERYGLKAEVITYETKKPDYAQSRIWSITCAREALRRYILSEPANYLLFLDADMVYQPSVVTILKQESRGFNVVQSGYDVHGMWGFGGGCLMLDKEILSKINFRCYEFKNGTVLQEDEVIDMDLFSCHARVKKGVFLAIEHYHDREKYKAIKPQPVGWFRSIANNLLIRYILVKISILTRRNILRRLHHWSRQIYRRDQLT